MILLSVVVSLVMGAMRIHGVNGEIFQGLAHVWVGALLGAWFVGKSRVAGWLGGGLTVLEVICASAPFVQKWLQN